MTDLGHQLGRVRLPARLAYLAILLLATLTSLDFDPGAASERLSRMLSPSVSARDAVDGARNLALFAGWGLVWMATAPAGRSLVSLGTAVATGALISLSVEAAQLFSSSRVASVLDVVTNSGGALAGAGVLVAIVVVTARGRGRRSFVGLPAIVFASAYWAAAFAEAMIPLFRQTAFANVFGGPAGRFRVSREMFEWSSLWSVPLGDILLFFPAGAFAVAAMSEAGLGYRAAVTLTAVAGLLVFVLAEVGHGFLGLPMQAGAVLAHAFGVAVGAAATAIWLPRLTRRLRGARRPRALLVAYAGVLLLWAFRPYLPELSPAEVTAKLSGDWWIPLGLLRNRVDMFSVVDVFTPFLLYLPLGALLAVWPVRERGRLALFWPAVYLAVTAELCQLFVLGRTLDVTDLLVQVSGVVIGWTVVRRAGFRPYGAAWPG